MDWKDPALRQQNAAEIADYIRCLVDRCRSLESASELRKIDPRRTASLLSERILDGILSYGPMQELADALFDAMDAGDAMKAGHLGVLYGQLMGLSSGITVEAENLTYEAVQLRRELGSRGGRSGKLTDSDIEFAQNVVNDFCRGTTNSFSAACMRAKKKLKDDRNVDIGDRRLRDILKDPTV